MANEAKYQGAHPQYVTKIIASYVSHHNVSPEQIPELIASVHRTFDNLGKPVESTGVLNPAVPVRRKKRGQFAAANCPLKSGRKNRP